jgi:hypothetical protein
MKRSHVSILVVLIFNALLITGSIIHGLHHRDITRYFREGETVTFFSTLFLGLTAWTAFVCSRLHAHLERNSKVNFWNLSFVAFFYLMLDENFMFHEGMDRAILSALGRPENLYNFDGWILGAMGMVALLLVFKSRHELLRYPDFFFLLKVGFFCFAGMVLADQFEGFSMSQLFDDSLKILGVSFFLAAYTNAFLAGLDRALPSRA